MMTQAQEQAKDWQGYNSSNSDGDSDDDEPNSKRSRKSGDGDGPDRKEKHKVVEQKRREKTKDLLSELQNLLPNTDDSSKANLTMNTVLQCAIDFLTSRTAASKGGDDAAANDVAGINEIDVAYRSGYMMTSMGIAYTGVDGTILEANPAFATMLGFGAEQRHKLIGRTLFSLTTPRDIQSTLKAVSKLLSGEIAHSLIIENCYRQDGNPGLFRMEMNCMWKANKAQCFVCFIRPADASGDVGGASMMVKQEPAAGMA